MTLLVVLWALQRSLIHLPSPGPVPPAASVLPEAREVVLQTEDGLEFGAWHVPGGAVHYPFLPVRALRRHRFPVAEQVARVQAPTGVVYGSADRVVPPEQSGAVAAASARLHQVVEVPGADHNDALLLVGNELVEAVVALAPAR